MKIPLETLSECRHRGPEQNGRFICNNNNLVKLSKTVSAEFCQKCCDSFKWCDQPHEQLRPAISKTERVALPTERPTCEELGEALTPFELEKNGFDASKCNCAKKIRWCDIHKYCTVKDPRPGMACCANCNEHSCLKTENAEGVSV